MVDDISYWRKLIPYVLDEFEVRVIESYDHAIEAIQTLDFEIAILDIRLDDKNLANVDGLLLLKEIRERKPKARVVLLTGYRKSIIEESLEKYRPFELVEKPFENSSFRLLIRRLHEEGSTE